MPTTDELDRRISDLEKKPGKMWSVLQFISPILLVAIGYYFNVQLENAKRSFQNLELELKQVHVAQEMLKELFSGVAERAFVTEKLLSKIVDEELGAEIHRIVADYYGGQLAESAARGDSAKIREIKTAAMNIGSDASKTIVETFERTKFHVVVESYQTADSALASANGLIERGYPSEVYHTPSGFFAVTLGSHSYNEANRIKMKAVSEGIVQGDAWLSEGKTWLERVGP